MRSANKFCNINRDTGHSLTALSLDCSPDVRLHCLQLWFYGHPTSGHICVSAAFKVSDEIKEKRRKGLIRAF